MRAAGVDVREQPIKNLCVYTIGPRATDKTGYGSANAAAISFDSTLKAVRVACPAGGTTDSGPSIANALSSTSINALGPTTYTLGLDVTGEVADGWRISAQGAWVSNKNIASAYVPVPVGQTVRIAFTFATLGGTGAIYLLRQTSSIAGQVTIRNVMFEQSRIAHPFADGESPGWQWLNTPGASTSVGYPRLA